MSISTLKTKFGNAKIDRMGYYRIFSCKEGNYRKFLHRLIFEDFYNIKLDEEFPEGVAIHHNDGDKTNNNIWNLIPMSIKDHSKLHNTGESHSCYGTHKSKETKEKISNALKNRPFSKERKINMSKSVNSVGFYHVFKFQCNRCILGFTYAYHYIDKYKKERMVTSVTLKNLKKKVLNLGLPWIVLDEKKARQSAKNRNEIFEELL